MKRFELKLDLFDGEGAGASAAGAEGAMSVSGGDATTAGVDNGETAAPAADTKVSFQDLIKGEYKEEADKYIQGVISKRFKANKDMEAKLAKQGEILDVVAGKYKADVNDLDGLLNAVQGDDSIYEDRALEEGLTVEQYKRIEQAEAKNRRFEAEQHRIQQEQQTQAQVQLWQQQAEQVRQAFPEFDLKSELANETFRKQIQMGIDMQSAYVAAHQAEILQGAMSYTAQEVRAAAARDIAAKGSRPSENAQSRRASATVKTDVSKLTKADREALSRRAMAGEVISFS